MYLSRLILNPRNRRVQAEVAHPYEMHRTIMRAFPDTLSSDAERVLFRLETNPRIGALTLLVQSWGVPDWSWLAALGERGYLLPVEAPNPAVKPFDLYLKPGQILAFRLLANPTVKRQEKRYGLCREEEQMAWLARKSERGGFRILSARASDQATVGGYVHRDDATHALHLLAVQFDGLLQVIDPDRLRETVRRGLGSGKGFGFGLLSLAPAQAF
jgi:CRISPR system Cascade subunit CasE